MEYNKNMCIMYYKSGEIEIIEGDHSNMKYHFYFRNSGEFIDLIKTSPKLIKEIKEAIE